MNEGDQVRVSRDAGASWVFAVPSSASVCSEQAPEMVDYCERLLTAFESYLTPISLTYYVESCAEDEPLGSTGCDSGGEPKTVTLEDENGITAADFVNSARFDRSEIPLIRRVPFDHNRVKVRLDAADEFVDRTDCVLYHKGEAQEVNSSTDPLSVVVSHQRADRFDRIESEFAVTFAVTLWGDIWARQTETGRINRKYLGEFLGNIDDAVSAQALQREKYDHSDYWHDLSLYRKGEGNVPFDPAEIY